eukprot:TRINITY_DN1355_c0_g1_i1.p1 TRINITY_DN1355_c0_g1~~TRINITY_DN1355_c0_g1_i1.p1  ORF type:complete len:339 (+),score=50.99 TRINITY_DN1355_c0_g1_i1:62-1078(+)
MKHVIFIFVSSLLFTAAFGHTGICATQQPSRFQAGAGAKVAASSSCVLTDCDIASNRDMFVINGDSTLYNVRLNVIYFGNPTQQELSDYEAQMDYFRKTYISAVKVNFTVTTQFVTDGPYLSTNSNDDATHLNMAKAYYKQDHLTILITTFSDNTGSLIVAGYSLLPQSQFTDFRRYYMILDHNYAISPTGNTILHEMGHVFGLLHTFTNTESCDTCSENVNSPDLNAVGDMCSDTLPVSISFDCDTLTSNKDCNNNQYGPISTLPQDNYMAYTPDTCQNRFTTQQTSRMRCYLTTMAHLSGAVIDFVAPPFSLKKVSAATHICTGVSAFAVAAMLLF